MSHWIWECICGTTACIRVVIICLQTQLLRFGANFVAFYLSLQELCLLFNVNANNYFMSLEL